MLENYEEMINKTINFYKSINIDVKDENKELAVASLTMPSYANEFKQQYKVKIDDHCGLSTVGDSVCGAYVMLKKYKVFATSEELTDEKAIVTNEHLNVIGKELLENHLFFSGNDLNEENKKSYATAFEAVVGFVALNKRSDLKKILKYIK